MPRVKIDYVVSFSSEDPDNPASNLLAWDVSKKRWLCAKGEPTCSVVLQLPRAVKISAVQIGAHHAALVEVLVGRSEKPNEPFQVLVPSCIFLTPAESRKESGVERVRSFGADQLAAAAGQRWDRVRLVCSQPYNKHCKYGLNFVHITEPEGAGPASGPAEARAASGPADAGAASGSSGALGPRIGSLWRDSNSSSDDEFRPGELFAKHKSPPADTGAQIRQATSQVLKNISDSATKLVKTPISKQAGRRTRPDACVSDRQRDDLMYIDDDDRPHAKIDHIVKRHKDEKSKDEAKKPTEKKHDRKSSYDSKDRKEDTQKTSPSDRHKDRNERNPRDETSQSDRHKDRNERNPRDETSQSDRHKDRNERNPRDETSQSDRHKDRNERNPRDETSQSDRHKDRNERNPRDDRKNRPNTISKDPRDEPSTSGSQDKSDKDMKRTRDDKHADQGVCDFSSILKGVVFVLSGYANPRRSALRDKALELGARCERDWGPRCTHLICAFPNTPKLRSVRAAPGGARVPAARGAWLEECHRLRRRLPWRWYATDRPEAPTPPDQRDQRDDECDTDDEIEKALRKQKKRRTERSPSSSKDKNDADESSKRRKYDANETNTSQNRHANVSHTSRDSDANAKNTSQNRHANVSNTSRDSDANVSNASVTFVRDERMQGNVTLDDSDEEKTDEEDRDASREPVSISRSARLPALFAGRSFALAASAARACGARLERYARAYGGLVIHESDLEPDSDVNYVLCTGPEPNLAPGAPRVRPDWLWRCHADRRLHPLDDYLITT